MLRLTYVDVRGPWEDSVAALMRLYPDIDGLVQERCNSSALAVQWSYVFLTLNHQYNIHDTDTFIFSLVDCCVFFRL